MTANRPVKITLLVASAWLLALSPASVWPGYLDSPARVLALPLFALAHGLHALGFPGLLQGQGRCGWGWCAPTAFGWVVSAVALLALLALVVVVVTRAHERLRRPGVRHNGAPPARDRP